MNKIYDFLRNNRDIQINWTSMSKLLILIFALIFIVLATMTPTRVVGECDDYMMPTITIVNHLSLQILESDVEQAKIDFPEFYPYIKSSLDRGAFLTSQDGKVYPWYMGTYSIACIPIKLILKFLGCNQSYAFAITNVLFYVGALYLVFKKLRTSDKNKFITILLLACSPTVLYYFWPSAEIFMFSLLIMALVFFVNKNHKLSALLISIIGTLNPTIMVFGMAIIIDYFIELYKSESSEKSKNFFLICVDNIVDIVKFGVCFLPFFITFLFNYIHFGTINVQASLGLAATAYWSGRFWAYLFDLNLGFLPYSFIAFPLSLLLLLYGIIFKRDTKSIVFAIGFLGTVGAYAIMFHINHGMLGTARYNAWAYPIFIFYLTTQAESLFRSVKIRKILPIVLIISALCTTGVVYKIRTSEHGIDMGSYVFMTPIAEWTLDNYPSLYNPYYYTFISRVMHEDGGYWGWWPGQPVERRPVVYSNDDFYIRKILVMKSTDIKMLEDNVVGNKKDLDEFDRKIKSLDYSKPFQYINFGKETKLMYIEKVKDEFNPVLYKDLEMSCKGIYYNEGTFHWCSPDATIRLRAGDKKKTGITIKYYVEQLLFDLNNLPEYKFDIIINGEYIKTVPLTKAGDSTVNVNPDEMPDSNGIYSIRLLTNASFSPTQTGNSADSRNLSIVLAYIGEK